MLCVVVVGWVVGNLCLVFMMSSMVRSRNLSWKDIGIVGYVDYIVGSCVGH